MDLEITDREEGLFLNGGPMAKGGATNIVNLSINKIRTGRNSRMDIRDDELAGLMQSIKETGLLQPIGVIKRKPGDYEICYGNRRFLACSKLGFKNITAVIYNNQNEYEVDMKNLTENIQRRNIGLVEAGRYIKNLRVSSDETRQSIGGEMKEFRNKIDGSGVFVYARGQDYFVKHTRKGQWLKRVAKAGPFKDEGTALLAACMSKEFKFSEFAEVVRIDANPAVNGERGGGGK